ncbi:uncharacterized protein C8R40DRAFT_1041204, partial [Lentinula edodes]|uniref:uncharacterized protein n=1 Tax=Lentinula edodes TaxID=5353 RepID=UPI001E8E5FF2
FVHQLSCSQLSRWPARKVLHPRAQQLRLPLLVSSLRRPRQAMTLERAHSLLVFNPPLPQTSTRAPLGMHQLVLVQGREVGNPLAKGLGSSGCPLLGLTTVSHVKAKRLVVD